MEAIADMLFDIRDERSIPSLVGALAYYVEGDGSYNFNVKLIDALKRIGTEDAVEGIKHALRSENEIIKEAAEEALESLSQPNS